MIKHRTPKQTKEDCIIYKKVWSRKKLRYFLLELFVPKGTYLYSPQPNHCVSWYRKVRVSQAVVLKAWGINFMNELIETNDKEFVPYFERHRNINYKVGKLIKPDRFSMKWERCANGIHGFFDPQDAIYY